MSDVEQELNNVRLLEGLLFAAPEPITAQHLATVAELAIEQVEEGLLQLEADLNGRGIRLQKHGSKYQLTTAPELTSHIENLLGLDATQKLSRAALETLAIIAYQQPITRPGVDSIRGVNSDGVMKSLLSKGLLQEVGRTEGPGRPILFGTTPEFLQHFGLRSVEELPPLETKIEAQENIDLLKS